MDAYGHVNNARFLTLYEEARVAMLFVGARAPGLDSFEEGIVIARHEIDYLRPVDYASAGPESARGPHRAVGRGDPAQSRFTVAYELFDGGSAGQPGPLGARAVRPGPAAPAPAHARERAFLRAVPDCPRRQNRAGVGVRVGFVSGRIRASGPGSAVPAGMTRAGTG